MNEEMEEVDIYFREFIEKTCLFIRHGECKRCGKCCIFITDKGQKPCEHLTYDNDIAICNIYDNRPTSCKDFPLTPPRLHQDHDYFNDCGYTWELDTSLTKDEALERLSIQCGNCHNKNPRACKKRIKTIHDILYECQ